MRWATKPAIMPIRFWIYIHGFADASDPPSPKSPATRGRVAACPSKMAPPARPKSCSPAHSVSSNTPPRVFLQELSCLPGQLPKSSQPLRWLFGFPPPQIPKVSSSSNGKCYGTLACLF